MIVLGVLLLALSGALTLGVVLSNTDPVSASAFGVSLSDVSVGGLFLAGAAAGMVLMLGVVLVLMGGARKRARRLATRKQQRAVRSEKEQLAQENATLRSRLDDPTPTPEHAPTEVTSGR